MAIQQELCANCGKPLSPGWRTRCEHCQAPMSVAAPWRFGPGGGQWVPVPQQPASTNNGRVFAVFGAIVVIIVGLYVLSNYGRVTATGPIGSTAGGGTAWVPAG